MKAKFSENFTFIFLHIQKGNRIVKEVIFFYLIQFDWKSKDHILCFCLLLVKAFAIFSYFLFILLSMKISTFFYSFIWSAIFFVLLICPGIWNSQYFPVSILFPFYLHPSLNDMYWFSSKCIQIIIHSWLLFFKYALYIILLSLLIILKNTFLINSVHLFQIDFLFKIFHLFTDNFQTFWHFLRFSIRSCGL